MKLQFLHSSLRIVLTSTVLLATATSAMGQSLPTQRVSEQEPNNRSTNQRITLKNTQQTSYTGSAGNNDVMDHVRFSISGSRNKAQRYTVALNASDRSGYRVIVYEDQNSNGIVERGERSIGTLQGGTSSREFDFIPRKSYILRVQNRSVRKQNYRVNFMPKNTPKLTLQVSILNGQAFSQFDPKLPRSNSYKPDFYVKVNSPIVSGKTAEQKNNDKPVFNKTFTGTKEGGRFLLNEIPIQISMWDADLGKDDQAYISPNGGRNLNIKYNPATGKISGPNGVLGKQGERIIVRGNSQKKRAGLVFMINHAVTYR
ncbi:hypothetical protein IQ266_05995 [filamentous cyanobacterium LEGE 11480]|uniref:C2 domain-containing protein n=1 Tax=Romeriopsis navalis LEGE 11480 TaxID=2777977 RepID=A0A928Z3K5_9CYAN|nr:C2 domain-containing protein [Romeriopsis navalis]MBE9029313.1 hypothetical protein [Romeriopsis navalis LEGE 11480]